MPKVCAISSTLLPALTSRAKHSVLAHLVGIEPRHVLDQRGFERRRVVTRLHDGAGQGLDLPALLLHRLGAEIPPPSGDDLERLAIRAHQQGLENAARPDARQDVGDVRRLAPMAHVGRRDFELAELDMSQLHDVSLGKDGARGRRTSRRPGLSGGGDQKRSSWLRASSSNRPILSGFCGFDGPQRRPQQPFKALAQRDRRDAGHRAPARPARWFR